MLLDLGTAKMVILGEQPGRILHVTSQPCIQVLEQVLSQRNLQASYMLGRGKLGRVRHISDSYKCTQGPKGRGVEQ